MAKQPYIPIYPGDWERDANCLKSYAEFALFKLTVKLNDAKNKGVYIADFDTLSTLFKCDIATAERSIKDLTKTDTLDIEYLEDGFVKIESRRILREKAISATRSEVGKTGGRGHKSKPKAKSEKDKAKPKQNTEDEIDNDNEIASEVKVVEDPEMILIFERWVKYKAERKESYKSKDSLKTAFEKLVRFSNGNNEIARKIIDDAIGNNYAGFFEPKPTPKPPDQTTSNRGATAVVNAFLQTKMNP